MRAIALRMTNALSGNLIAALVWVLVGIVSTYLTTTTAEAQIAGEGFCTLFTNSGKGLHDMAVIGHCAWCYAAIAAFGASIVSLFRK